jgi:hypothetical protein
MKRRGTGLAISMILLTIVGATVSLIVLQIGRMAQTRRDERLRACAILLAESGLAYAEGRGAAPAAGSEVIHLPTAGLAPRGVTADLELRMAGDGAIRIVAVASRGSARATEERMRRLQVEKPQ